jgi:hypothetical protein
MGSIPAGNMAEVSLGVLNARLRLRLRLSRVMGFIPAGNMAGVSPGVPRYLTSLLACRERERKRERIKWITGGRNLGFPFAEEMESTGYMVGLGWAGFFLFLL